MSTLTRGAQATRVSIQANLFLLAASSLAVILVACPVNASIGCDVTTIQAVAPGATTITFAAMVTSTTPPATYCDVKGSIATSSDGQNNTTLFELGLPISPAWIGDFVFIGNSGFGGSIQPVGSGHFVEMLSFGLAAAATDTGHESALGPLGFLDGSFGLIGVRPAFAAREDFSDRAVHLSATAGETITAAYYGSGMFSYFDGCSTGGRQAMVEAENFPTDFNGIIAGDPSIGDPKAGFNWNEKALLQSSAGYLTQSDIELVDQAVLAECDGLDGVVDGLIQDPRRCQFHPKTLLCHAGKTTNCLSSQQVKTLKQIYSGAVTVDNVQLYPGFTVSDPGGPDGWIQWITGSVAPQFGVANPWGAPPDSLGVAPLQWSFQDQFMKYFVFDNPDYNSLTFKFWSESNVKALRSIVTEFQGNGENINLSPFFKAGGKLIMYHGWSDPALTPLASVRYYKAVANFLYGGDFSKLRKHARLFMVPGMHHCGGGPGPNVFDPLTALIDWVQFGVAPDSITATHFVNNDPAMGVDRVMPLCPYPKTAKYISGSINVLSSWTCANP